MLAQMIFEPAPLPKPRGLAYWLFEQPFLVATVVAIVSAAVLIAMRRLGKDREVKLAGAAGGIIVASVLLAGRVETDRERVIAQTRGLIGAALAADAPVAGAMVARDLRVTALGGDGSTFLGRDTFLAIVRGIDRVGVRDSSTTFRGAFIDGPGSGRVDFGVSVQTSGGAYSGKSPSRWRFSWRKENDGGWMLVDLELLSFNAQIGSDSVIRAARRFAQ